MLQFRDIGTYKNATNIPNYTCATKLRNGMVVAVNHATKVAALPDATTAKGDVFLVLNRIDKPETLKPNDYAIEIGEYPRLFRVKSLSGKIIDMDMDQVATAYASVSVGSKLTANTDGKLVVTADVSTYATYLEVVEKTTYGGQGLAAIVVVADL